MKAIMISIKPKWVAKILNGEKTIEIRKRFPIEYRGWVYIYCTKGNKSRYNRELLRKYENVYLVDKIDYKTFNQHLNGKVVARFYCDNVEEIKYGLLTKYNIYGVPRLVENYKTKSLTYRKLRDKSCLNANEFENYFAKSLVINGIVGDAIHISQLEVFDKPKELWEFMLHIPTWKKTNTGAYYKHIQLTKAPQNYCYVEVE